MRVQPASKSPVRLPSCRAVRCSGIFVASIRLKRESFYSTLVTRILKSFPEALGARAAQDLQQMGVEIHSGTRVTGVDESGIDTNSTDPQIARIEAATKFWAAGVQASPLGRLLAKVASVEVDRAGRVKVQSDCTLPGHPEVFVIGDLMSLDNLPGLAQVAIQSGRHAAETIVRRIAGDTTQRPFRYRDRGTLATISRLRAIAAIGPAPCLGFHGMVALASHPPRCVNGLQESRLRPLKLDDRVPRSRTCPARYHCPAGLRTASARKTSRDHVGGCTSLSQYSLTGRGYKMSVTKVISRSEPEYVFGIRV